MNTPLKTTPLNDWHKAANANMADFGGFDMPLWYETGVKIEHLAVLKSAGIFDTSHMACICALGKDAFELLNFCFIRDISTLVSGRCVYGAFLDDNGHCIDDAVLYKFSDSVFMICVNAGMGESITRHLEAQKKDRDVTINDLSGKVGKIDIQGVNSAKILFKIIRDPEIVFKAMPYFSFKGSFSKNIPSNTTVRMKNGTPLLLSRSGYTGEFGFEIFIHPDGVLNLWTDLLDAGKEMGICTCGLGARDSLRVGACLPLSHQDIGEWKFIHHPWDFALPYNEDKSEFTKNFLGADALKDNKDNDFVYAFAGDSLRKISAGDQTKVMDSQGNVIGKVLTCATDMGITWRNGKIVSINSGDCPANIKIKGIACGFVMVSKELSPGTRLILVKGKRKIPATITTDIRPDRTARKKLDCFI